LNNWKEYKNKIVMARFPDSMRQLPGILLGYNDTTDRYELYSSKYKMLITAPVCVSMSDIKPYILNESLKVSNDKTA
jgi:hypothetical protein